MDHYNLQNERDFKRLYLTYFPKLVRFAREYVCSQEDAENIVQDVFLVIWKQKETLDYLENIQAFLFRLTKNKCIDFLRRQILIVEKEQAMQEVELREFTYRLSSMESFDEFIFGEDDLTVLIHKAIESLPPRCKEIFRMSRFEGMSHQEIAMHFDISPSTVNNHISVAMKKLKEELKDYFPLLLLWLLS